MSLRITHANPKGLELGTSEQQIVLAKDDFGAKQPTDFRPVVSTFRMELSCLLSLTAAACQVLVCSFRHFLLEQRGDVGAKGSGRHTQPAWLLLAVPFPLLHVSQRARAYV